VVSSMDLRVVEPDAAAAAGGDEQHEVNVMGLLEMGFEERLVRGTLASAGATLRLQRRCSSQAKAWP
jgi:hypothetical protein